MKNIIYLLFICIYTNVNAQNYSIPDARMRVNKTSSLSITTGWKTVYFNGTSTYNINTFGGYQESGNPVVWYGTDSLFHFQGEYDRNYQLQLFFKTTTTVLTTRAFLQYRIVIPNGISTGVPLYLPFPDDGGYEDIIDVTVISSGASNSTKPLTIYANDKMRTNGFKVQVKLSNSLFTLGTCTLNSASALIQPLK